MSKRQQSLTLAVALGVMSLAAVLIFTGLLSIRDASANGNPPTVTYATETGFMGEVAALGGGGYWTDTSVQIAYFSASDDLTAPGSLTYTAQVTNMTNIAGAAPTVTTSSNVQLGQLIIEVKVEWAPNQLQYTSSYVIHVQVTDAGSQMSPINMPVDRN